MTENTPNRDFKEDNYNIEGKKLLYICSECRVPLGEIPKQYNKELSKEEGICGCGSKLFFEIEEWVMFKF